MSDNNEFNEILQSDEIAQRNRYNGEDRRRGPRDRRRNYYHFPYHPYYPMYPWMWHPYMYHPYMHTRNDDDASISQFRDFDDFRGHRPFGRRFDFDDFFFSPFFFPRRFDFDDFFFFPFRRF